MLMGMMRPIEFEDGPLEGCVGKVGRLPADVYDYVERHGAQVLVHRYRCVRKGQGWTARYLTTLGRIDAEELSA